MLARVFLLLWCLSAPLTGWSKIFTASPDTVGGTIGKLKAGDTLLLKAGVYRMTLTMRFLEGQPDAPIVIKAEGAPGSVVIRGSDVLSKWDRVDGNLYVHRLDLEPSQVFVDGVALQQWGGTVFDGFPLNRDSAYAALHPNDGGIWPGRRHLKSPDDLVVDGFFYDAGKRRLYVRSSRDLLGNVTVEASQRPHGLFAQYVKHLVIDGISVQHANTSVVARGGALVVWGDHVVIRRVSASWNDLAGIQFGGDHILLEDAQANYNGQMGVTGRGRFNEVRRVVANFNNRRGFNKWWEAGGFKFIGESDGGMLDSKVTDCQALHNAGDGFWFDWKNARIELGNNLSAYNAGFGVHYEVSSEGLIHGNVVVGNGQRGIYLSSSEQTQVINNLVLGNGLEGIVSIWDRDRRDHRGRQVGGQFNIIENNVVAWNKEGSVIIPTNGGARSDRNVFLGEGPASRFSMDFPGAFNPPVYGLQAWAERAGQDKNSWWQNRPMPQEWRQFLARKGTELEPLIKLLNAVRQEPPEEGLVTGDNWSKSERAARATRGVGPRHLGSVK